MFATWKRQGKFGRWLTFVRDLITFPTLSMASQSVSQVTPMLLNWFKSFCSSVFPISTSLARLTVFMAGLPVTGFLWVSPSDANFMGLKPDSPGDGIGV